MMNELAKFIRETAADNGWSLRQVARRSDLPAATVQKVVSADVMPRIDTLEALARGLGVPKTQLLELAAKSSGYTRQKITTDDISVVAAALNDLSPKQVAQVRSLVQSMLNG
jgi:transcriptional regulator with XRE-family HTH domain